ncbi:hypothetical protein BGX31_009559 [Mortierella sp. GBA43]|nr:hypothetical protein BGX31_009559 [Mortierella sp. GBA43]
MQDNRPSQDTTTSEQLDVAHSSSQTKRAFTDMPTEVLMAIALALPCKEFARFLQTCRTVHNTVNSHYVWHQRFTTRFGQLILQERLKELKSGDKAKTDEKESSTPSSRASSRASTAPPSPRFPPNVALAANTGSSSNLAGTTLGQTLQLPTDMEHYHNHQDPSSASSSSGAASPLPPSALSDGDESGSVSVPGSGSSSDAEGEGNDKDDESAKKRAKGKGRKIDLRKTNEASKELLIELYKRYSEDMFICHMGDRYWRMIDSGSSTFGRIAQLQSVWWMDVAAVFYGVPKGRYKIQWRLKVTSDAPIINTDFRARFFEKHEDRSAFTTKPDAVLFKPKNIQAFREQTDSDGSKANRKPFRKMFQGFTILELPDILTVEEDFQNVHTQIFNEDGWKSGLCVDFARLIDMDDPAKNTLLRASGVQSDRSAALEEDVNDEGEEYYPGPSGPFNPIAVPWQHPAQGSEPFSQIFRTRAVRQFNPVDGSLNLDVGASEPPGAVPSTQTSDSPSGSRSTTPSGSGSNSCPLQ